MKNTFVKNMNNCMFKTSLLTKYNLMSLLGFHHLIVLKLKEFEEEKHTTYS